MQKAAPITPGYCFLGSVAALGSDTTDQFSEGDLVTAVSVYDSEATRINIGPIVKLLARNLTPGTSIRFYYISRDDRNYASDTETLLELLAKGEIKPLVKCVIDLDRILDAHKAWGKAPGMGSMLIKVGEEPKRQ